MISPDEKIYHTVTEILTQIQPALQSHGGGAELASVQDGRVEIKLKGACHGCDMAAFTFGMMVDAEIKNKVPGVKEIVYA